MAARGVSVVTGPLVQKPSPPSSSSSTSRVIISAASSSSAYLPLRPFAFLCCCSCRRHRIRSLGSRLLHHRSSFFPSDQRSRERSMASSSTASIPSTPTDGNAPVSDDVSSLAIIFEPIKKEGSDVLLYFLPGAFTAPAHYISILKDVQSRCDFRLWVAILDPGNALIRTGMVEGSFDGVLNRLKQMGFRAGSYPSQNIIFGGHSWGAWESRAVALKRAEAFIQLGSCFHNNPDNLVQYPKPVLTLSGELDGQITLATIAKHAGEVYAVKDELGDFYVHAIKPVIIVPGMNHAQVNHCIPNKERGDLDAEISAEQAKDTVAALVSSFITVHVSSRGEEASACAVTVLRDAVRQTHELYKSFWEAIEDPGRNVKKAQLELAALSGLTESNIAVVRHDYKDNFIYSKPWIDVESKRIIVNTYLSPVGNLKVLNNVWVKLKSREAVALTLKNGEKVPEMHSIGAHFNQRTFAEALALVPEALRKKFEERGKKLRFLEDLVITSSAQEWIDSDLIMKPAEDGTNFVEVQSTALISPARGIADRFAGMHYVKLLTVARAMSWIFLDSYR